MSIDPTQLWISTEAAERWQRMAAQRQQAVGAATDMMFEAVGLEPGFRVLDLAAGTGDTTMVAARRVGTAGSVLAVDISGAMLEEASRAAAREGLGNVQTLVSDIVALDVTPASFDAAISRFGLMFLSDVVEGLRRVHRALKPNARLAALVWSTADRNPNIFIPLAISEKFRNRPPDAATARRAMSLGGPGVFDGALKQAGFAGVSVQPVATPREFDSLDAAVEATQQNSPVWRELLAELEPTAQADARGELRERLAEFVGDGGRCTIPGEALLGVANT